MAKTFRTFVSGKMNKVVDERLIPEGEYIDALNIRMASPEGSGSPAVSSSSIGVIENSKGNEKLTTLAYINNVPLSSSARCIGAIEDTKTDTIYWFVHDPNFLSVATDKVDMIVSYNLSSGILTYHVVSTNDGGGVNTTLNFSPTYLITGANIIDDYLYWTDDYNPPRFININRSYANPTAGAGGIDYNGQPDILREALQVIKKPPVSAPSIQLYNTVSQEENFLKDRFISFAYRYKYADGEYSATSQWSEVAFSPKDFQFDIKTWLNSGMENEFNSCNVTYNSGGPLVTGIDLLFKESSSNVIRVIEKIDKAKQGISNNTDYIISFDNSKIFTILPESELLRLYDNVPRLAKAQTVMGNRIMYGNYLEGYDLIDINSSPCNISYVANPISVAAEEDELITAITDGFYNIDPTTGTLTVNDSSATIIVTQQLSAGSQISFDITFEHDQWSGQAPFPNVTTQASTISFSFILPSSYPSLAQMVSSPEFQSAIGTIANIQTIPNACLGGTLTDQFNCAIPTTLGGLIKNASGINATGEPISATASTITFGPFINVPVIIIQLPAMQFLDNVLNPTQIVYEYYKILGVTATFQKFSTPTSLHSNRGYEIGIVYMDDFGRSTTALVSQNNTVHFPCSTSDLKNTIQVSIPTNQRAPAWAKKYKFVIKPDTENYETIYSNTWFLDPSNTNNSWFLLEGENARKVEAGDRLIVKADTSGPIDKCTYVTVLEKESKQKDAFTVSPQGVYMKVCTVDLYTVKSPNSVFTKSDYREIEHGQNFNFYNLYHSWVKIDAHDGTANVSIPAGSKIVFNIRLWRNGVNSCDPVEYTWNKTFYASTDYADLKAWFEGDGIDTAIGSGVNSNTNSCSVVYNYYQNTIIPNGFNNIYSYISAISMFSQCEFYWTWYDDGAGKLSLIVTSTNTCSGNRPQPNNRKSKAQASMTIFRSLDTFIFETMPQDALPDVFFENNFSYDIDPATGNHLVTPHNNPGDVAQNIALGTSGVINTGFFNCFTFGNGAESYKAFDSIVGKPFNLGQRVTTVAAQDYKEARRYADITYSGIYNNETNVNRLNEFNLGLLNFKTLEDSFGRIFKMDGRETDVLVLQEDKVSYVLAGKNLLSDAAAGSAVTSVPEVLGTQMARTEKYGISFNPESYVHWGQDRYFTDAKRGAVLQLKGNSYSNDQIAVISEYGMRTWFRDEFNASFNTQKLGGFDPYMNEYVLSTNDISVPIIESCLDCGLRTTKTVTGLTSNEPQFEFCVDLGSAIGDVVVSWQASYVGSGPTIVEFNSYQIFTTYNGNDDNSGPLLSPGLGTITIDKNSSLATELTVGIGVNGPAIISISVSCPEATPMNIIEVVVTGNVNAGETIHTEYRYVDGVYVSPTQSSLVTFGTNINDPFVISRYSIVSGLVGTPGFPNAGSTMYLQANKIAGDTFNFDPLEDKFFWHRSNTLYPNTILGVNSLLTVATQTTSISQSGNVFYDEFTVPASTPPLPILGDYLYLIWDFREAVGQQLCYTNVEEDVQYICCECEPCAENCIGVKIDNGLGTGDAYVTTEGVCGSPTGQSFTVPAGGLLYVCIQPPITIPITNDPNQNYYPIIEILDCGCTPCEQCEQWAVRNITEAIVVEWTDCDQNQNCVILDPVLMNTNTYVLCAKNKVPPIISRSTSSSGAYFEYLRCDCCVTKCYGEELAYVDFDPTDQIVSIAIDCGSGPIQYNAPDQQPLYVNNSVGVINFILSVLPSLDGISYSFYYDQAKDKYTMRFNYSCCVITQVRVKKSDTSIDTVTFEEVDCPETQPC